MSDYQEIHRVMKPLKTNNFDTPLKERILNLEIKVNEIIEIVNRK